MTGAHGDEEIASFAILRCFLPRANIQKITASTTIPNPPPRSFVEFAFSNPFTGLNDLAAYPLKLLFLHIHWHFAQAFVGFANVPDDTLLGVVFQLLAGRETVHADL